MIYKKTKRMSTMQICEDCGTAFSLSSLNQKFCHQCRRQFTRLDEGLRRLKAAADASGNPKIWTADQYDQNFLKTLIPSWRG